MHLLFPVDTSFIRSALLVLILAARPLLGLFGKMDPPPVKFTRPLARLASALGFFYGVRSPTP